MRQFFTYLYLLLLLVLLLAWLCLYIPPHVWWPGGFLAMVLPFALLGNLVFAIGWLLRPGLRLLMPLAVLVAFYGYYARGFKFFSSQEEVTNKTLQALSYNVRVFNIYRHLHSDDRHEVNELVSFLTEHPAQVLCLQEYFNSKDASELQATKLLKKKRPNARVSVAMHNRVGDEFGLAIFSVYPIISHGVIKFDSLSPNHAMYADIVLPTDTVRIINFHLQSMAIDESKLPGLNDAKTQLKIKGFALARRLRKGMVTRSKQVEELQNFIAESPYSVIVSGDLNDLPYSYTYQRMRSQLQNAFEEKGRGLGVTHNGKLPGLRIDNQFYSKALHLLHFETLQHIRFTDHYPIAGTYRMP